MSGEKAVNDTSACRVVSEYHFQSPEGRPGGPLCGFQSRTADCLRKRFTVIQAVALPKLDSTFQMTVVRNLMESRPMRDRVPDQPLIVSQPEESGAFIRAARGRDHAFIYSPYGFPVTIQMGRISGEQVNAARFNPRNGKTVSIGEFENQGSRTFVPLSGPGRGNDWVLILDDASKR